jgi:hypothetical protein
MRITDSQIATLRNPELTADRVRDIRQTGLTTGTLNEMFQDVEDDLRQVRDKSEIEDGRVRTDSESGNSDGGETAKREREERPPSDEDEELRRRAAEDLLNLPVTKSKDSEVETSRFDVRV